MKEQKPKTAEELGNLANLHVQARKGPLISGKYASFSRGQGLKQNKELNVKEGASPTQTKQGQMSVVPQKFVPPSVRNAKPELTCFKCGKKGHMSL